jgi:hypothetical protein
MHYFYLNEHHFPEQTDPLWSWYRDLDCEDVVQFARQHISPEVLEWLSENTSEYDIRAYVIPFSDLKILVGFRSPRNAIMFKLTWL